MFTIAAELHHAVDAAIAGCPAQSWEENHLTYLVVDAICGVQSPRRLNTGRGAWAVAWHGYKLGGPPEQGHGDVAVMVRVSRPGGTPLLGVGFLEAKLRVLGAAGLRAFDRGQATRILANTRYSHFMLYEREPVVSPSPKIHRPWPMGVGTDLGISRCPVIQTTLVERFGDRLDLLHDFSVPFSWQLVARYFHGHDLQLYESEQAMATSLLTRDRRPDFILGVLVSAGGRDAQVRAPEPPPGYEPIERTSSSQ